MKTPGTMRLSLSWSYDLLYGIGLGTFGFMLDRSPPVLHARLVRDEPADAWALAEEDRSAIARTSF